MEIEDRQSNIPLRAFNREDTRRTPTVNHRSRSRGLIRGSRRSCTTRRLYFVAYNARDDNRTNPIIPPTNPVTQCKSRTSHLLCGPSGSSGNCLDADGDKLFAQDRIHASSLLDIYIYIWLQGFFSFLIRREIGQIKIRSEFESGTRIYSVFGSSVLTRKRIFFTLRWEISRKFLTPLFPRKRTVNRE